MKKIDKVYELLGLYSAEPELTVRLSPSSVDHAPHCPARYSNQVYPKYQIKVAYNHDGWLPAELTTHRACRFSRSPLGK